MGKIKVTECPIQGLYIIEPHVIGDDRGYFFEAFNQRDLEDAGLRFNFVQENQSLSSKGAIRGLHFQKQYPQAKLARVLRGSVFDVAVDLRSSSSTYGQWYGVELSEENKKMLLVPAGFAHGLLSLTDGAVFSYKCNDFYHPGDEGGIAWNDPAVGIQWPDIVGDYSGTASAEGYRMSDGSPLILSEKDQKWRPLSETFKF